MSNTDKLDDDISAIIYRALNLREDLGRKPTREEVEEIEAWGVDIVQQWALDIVGDDEQHTRYMKVRNATEDVKAKRGWAWVIAQRRNQLRAELRKKIKGEE